MTRMVCQDRPVSIAVQKNALRCLQIGMGWFPEQTGGLNRYYHGLVRHLTGAGVIPLNVVMADQSYAGLQVAAKRGDSLWVRWRGIRRAVNAALAEQIEPRVIASHFALYAFPVRHELGRRPHVVHFHGPWADESLREGGGRLTTAAKRWLESRVYATADQFIVLSDAFKRVLTERYNVDGERIEVIPGGIDARELDVAETRDAARQCLGWPTDRPIVFCVRRLARRMGLATLIEAVGGLRRQHPDVLVLIGGMGPLKGELARRISALGLAHYVRLLDYVADDDLPLAYRAADLTVVPTQALEGFGLITIESLAAGTPVLVTPVGGLTEAVTGLSPSLVLGGTGVTAVEEGIDAALSGRLELPSAEACRSYALTNFDWPVIAARVAEVYRHAAESASA